MTDKVLYEKKGEVAYITLNRPRGEKRDRSRNAYASARDLDRFPR